MISNPGPRNRDQNGTVSWTADCACEAAHTDASSILAKPKPRTGNSVVAKCENSASPASMIGQFRQRQLRSDEIALSSLRRRWVKTYLPTTFVKESRTMGTRARIRIAVAMLLAAALTDAISQSAAAAESGSSDVYIQQSRGRVAPSAKVQQPPPESTSKPIQSTTGSTAPVTCNAQNASSQACYTATQQARPGR
jgi:hypothetical protein